jgi:myo-inositol-hexaphosphate 3-phosphohydrolase
MYKNLINFSYVTFLMCLYYIDPNGELCKYLKGVAEAEDVQSYVKTNAFGLPAITNTHTDWIYYSRIRYRAGNKIRLYIMDELNYI